MRSRIRWGNLCMMSGVMLLTAALALFSYNMWEDKKAGEGAGQVLEQVLEQTGKDGDIPNPYDLEMKEIEVNGYAYIGYLSIPSQELELPVMSEWDLTRLQIAPCRYAGSTKTHNLVVAAHNYHQHFGKLQNLSIGDEVYFTDVDGIVTTYRVAEMDILAPTAVKEMTDGEYDLTLFTCNYAGNARMTIRCEEAL